MERIWLPTVAFVFLLVIESASSDFEGSIGELHFTIPVVTGNFNEAVSWCKTNNNSTLAVVNDSDIQMALSSVLSSSSLRSMMHINVKLYPKPNTAWFLLNGSSYNGGIGNQDPMGATYSFHCRLRYVNNDFTVEASAPSDFREYICDYEEERCSSDSDNNIVYNKRCYVKYENETLTWYKARERCINYGGDLAQFQPAYNPYSPPFSTSWLSNSLTYWVGIRWKDWSWKPAEIDQEYIFTSWSDGKPNNQNFGCACVDPNGSPPWSWTDSDCATQRNFVCLKKNPTPETTTSSKSNAALTVSAKPATQNCVIDEDGVCLSICPQPNKSEALIVGLVLGIGVIIPLIIIVLVLGVANVHLKRQLSEKSSSNKDVSNLENTTCTSISEDRTSTDAASPDTHYQHLHNNSRLVTMIPLYEQLNQP